MIFKKLVIIGELAHFKNSVNGKNQNTFKVPPVSTIVGILKNIYGKDIQDFIFGYTTEYKTTFKDITTIYKETIEEKKGKRFESDICRIEYLIDPIITIYTNLNNEIQMSEILNLGKTNCLAKCLFRKSNIILKSNIGYNQWTSSNVGSGIITRINLETIFNERKGYYDYITKLCRLNEQFNTNYCDNDTEEGLFLWNYKKEGEIECYQEKL